MGNTLNTNVEMSTLKKCQRKLTKKRLSHSDRFIVHYVQNVQKSIKCDPRSRIDISPLDTRRVVFVSLIGFYQTWKQCPLHILYTCLLLMPLKREWLYSPAQYQHESSSEMASHLSLLSGTDTAERELFIELLKWKDEQGLVCWMLDHGEPRAPESALIHPIWSHLDQTLTRLYDPITRARYHGINFNEKWWQNKMQSNSKYGVKPSALLSELYFAPLKFKTIQEIIYQSNPNALIPLVSYTECSIKTVDCNQKNAMFQNNLFGDFDDEDEIENWWISDEYDPYQ